MTNNEKSFIELNQIEALELLKEVKAESFRYEQNIPNRNGGFY